jgi:hypothetical protein
MMKSRTALKFVDFDAAHFITHTGVFHAEYQYHNALESAG